MNRLTMFDMKKSEGRILRTALAVMLAVSISIWGIVPSSVVFAEDDATAKTGQEAGQKGDESGSDSGTKDGEAKDGSAGSDGTTGTTGSTGSTGSDAATTEGEGAKAGEGDGGSKDDAAATSGNDQGENNDAVTDGVAAIGDKQYETLQAAIDAAADGETVTLLKDTEENVEIKSRNSDKVMTIDLGGKTLRPADANEMVIYVNGGKDITIKNGKITGSSVDNVLTGAIHVLADKATIENIEFDANPGTALSAHYAVAMYDDYHFEKHEVSVKNCTFSNNGSRSGEKAYPAVHMSGYSATFDNCSFWKNDRSIVIFSQKPDNDVEVEYNIRNTRFSECIGRVIDAGIPSGSDLNMYNVFVNDNDITGSDDSLLYFHGIGAGMTEGGSAVMNWCKVYGNTGAEHTIVTDTPSSLSLYGATIENNSAEETGAICAMNGYVIFNAYTVVRNNSATGSGERACGGVTVRSITTQTYEGDPGSGSYVSSGGSAFFVMYGGALYGNTSEKGEFAETDLYVDPKSYMTNIISPEKFAGHSGWTPVDEDFTDYKWIEQKKEKAEETPAMYSDKARVYKIAKDDSDARKAESVYIDGVNGSDEDGDGTKDKPVRTFAKAKEILEANDAKTIYILGKVTVTGEEEWSLPKGARLERCEEYKGVCVEVAKDASLTVKDMIIDGAADNDVKGVDSLIRVYGELNIEDGALLRNNDIGTSGSKGSLVDITGTVNIKGGTIEGGTINTGTAGPIYLRNGSTCNMTGGKICDTLITEASSGRNDTAAVVLRSGSTFNMSGGSIENNISKARLQSETATSFTPQLSSGGISVDYKATVNISGDALLKNNESAAGGAIYMQDSSIVNISGGTFEGNKARRNGGAIIVAGLSPKLTVTGGTFKDNEASDQGGAIWTYGTSTVVTGGKFFNNSATRYGGAIALAEYNGSFLTLKNAIIRNNTASIAGGGVWICPVGGIVFEGEEGVAIYDNKAEGAGDDFVSVPNTSWMFGGVSQRKFGVYLSDTTLADQRVAWYNDGWVSFYQQGLGKVSDTVPRFDPENPGERVYVQGTKMSGLSLKAQISDEGKAVLDSIADSENVVLFEGNHAYRGGAIGGNSNVINTEEWENPEEEELRITKSWAEDIVEEDIPDEITVNLLLDGKVIDTVVIKKADNWTGKFRGLIKEYLDAGRYTIEEVELDKFVGTCSDIIWANAPADAGDAQNDAASTGDAAAIDGAATETEEDLTHVWTATVTNSKRPEEVKEESEEPEEPPREEKVKPAQENPKTKAKVKGNGSSPKGTNTGDFTKLMPIMIIMLMAAAMATGTILWIRRRSRQAQ